MEIKHRCWKFSVLIFVTDSYPFLLVLEDRVDLALRVDLEYQHHL